MVQPETVIRWHREAWKRYWTWRSQHRSPGRPRIAPELRELIIRMARENPLWGAQRIRGELLGLGYEVGRETVRRYMHAARRRPPSQTWQTFLKNHAPDIWACDFFTVPTLSFRTLYVFFFIEQGKRKLVHVNVTAHPTAEWVWRQLIQATPWREQPRFLLRDREPSSVRASSTEREQSASRRSSAHSVVRKRTALPSVWSGRSASNASTM